MSRPPRTQPVSSPRLRAAGRGARARRGGRRRRGGGPGSVHQRWPPGRGSRRRPTAWARGVPQPARGPDARVADGEASGHHQVGRARSQRWARRGSRPPGVHCSSTLASWFPSTASAPTPRWVPDAARVGAGGEQVAPSTTRLGRAARSSRRAAGAAVDVADDEGAAHPSSRAPPPRSPQTVDVSTKKRVDPVPRAPGCPPAPGIRARRPAPPCPRRGVLSGKPRGEDARLTSSGRSPSPSRGGAPARSPAGAGRPRPRTR